MLSLFQSKFEWYGNISKQIEPSLPYFPGSKSILMWGAGPLKWPHWTYFWVNMLKKTCSLYTLSVSFLKFWCMLIVAGTLQIPGFSLEFHEAWVTMYNCLPSDGLPQCTCTHVVVIISLPCQVVKKACYG